MNNSSSNLFHIPLVRGQTYTVLDLYGMIAWQGSYEGIIEDENRLLVDETSLLLFKIHREKGSSSYKWAGVIPEVKIDSGDGGDRMEINLRASYYGNTPTTIKRWNDSGRLRKSKWVRVKP